MEAVMTRGEGDCHVSYAAECPFSGCDIVGEPCPIIAGGAPDKHYWAYSNAGSILRGIVTLAIFTCQRGDALIGHKQENQWLGDFRGGAGPLQNPLFLANVTMPPSMSVCRPFRLAVP